MKKYLIIFIVLFFQITVYSQTYSPKNFPTGSTTAKVLKQNFTNQELKTMLEEADISKNIDDENKLGFVFTNPRNLQQILVCNTDSYIIMFEYIKMLKQEIATLKQRLQSAGIP